MAAGAGSSVDTPLHLRPLLVPKPWGGRRLERFGKDLPAGAMIGESWEVADLDPSATSVEDPVSRVASGPHAGRTLQEVIATDRDGLLGDAPDLDGRFPLLVKLLDAREHLSVQVHPPADYVADHPEVSHKTESWVVLDAEPGAELMIGVASGVTTGSLASAVGTPALVPMLRRVPAVPGEVHHLPAGTIHALPAGVMVAEVQTPGDTTFRVYDWVDKYGRTPRALHLREALRSIELGWEHNLAAASSFGAGSPGRAGAAAGGRVKRRARGTVVDTPHYRIARRHLDAAGTRSVDRGTMRIVLVLDGVLQADAFDHALGPGGTIVLPAAWHGCLRAADESVTWLELTVPPKGNR
ncbi:MAG: mannose-6-phosphate isomerase [Nitriliruptor sp.]|nr:MAG: mannose-6-phosphate isomerase [Nitriliruptor sp.]